MTLAGADSELPGTVTVTPAAGPASLSATAAAKHCTAIIRVSGDDFQIQVPGAASESSSSLQESATSVHSPGFNFFRVAAQPEASRDWTLSSWARPGSRAEAQPA